MHTATTKTASFGFCLGGSLFHRFPDQDQPQKRSQKWGVWGIDVKESFMGRTVLRNQSIEGTVNNDRCTNYRGQLRLQLLTTSFIVIIIVNDSTNKTHYGQRPCLSGGQKPSLEQSAAYHHISSDSCCFPESTPNLPVLSFVHSITDICTPFSSLALFLRTL